MCIISKKKRSWNQPFDATRYFKLIYLSDLARIPFVWLVHFNHELLFNPKKPFYILVLDELEKDTNRKKILENTKLDAPCQNCTHDFDMSKI